MGNKRNLTRVVLAGALALGLTACLPPILKDVKDYTGDGIKDVHIYNQVPGGHGRDYIFIGQEDGSYLRSRIKEGTDHIKYLRTSSGENYIFNGEFYVAHPNQDIEE